MQEGGDVYTGFVQVVKERLRGAPLSCEYEIPPPPDGLEFDRDEVNVDYDDGLGFRTIGRVDSAEGCADVPGAWYYDDADDPTEILMCPLTCDLFKVVGSSSIEIRFGCETVQVG